MSIAENRKARHDYFIEERYEAGIVLEGWEVKAIRAGRAQMKEGYVVIRSAELVPASAPTSRPWPPHPPTSSRIRCARASCCCGPTRSAS
jgi:predicted transcriptional regulator